MLTIVTDPAFIDPETSLAFDVEVSVEIVQLGFKITYKQRFKNSQGNYIEKIRPELTDEGIPASAAQTVYNNVLNAMINRTKNKFTP